MMKYFVATVISICFISVYLLFPSLHSAQQYFSDRNLLNIAPKISIAKIGNPKTVAPNTDVPEGRLDRDCQCKKISKDVSQTTAHSCSEFSTSRGPNQKVISFTFYGGFKTIYYQGIKYNVEGVKKYYPGYIMRLYHDMENPYMEEDGGKAICEMYCKEDILDLCNVRYIDWYYNLQTYFGMLWRFAPMADPLVIEWYSRDLDSRITEREISAVDDWKASNKTYHVMRDHPEHRSMILGGCFGMKTTKENSLIMRSDFDNMLLRSKKVWRKGLDQELLNRIVWPRAMSDMVAHDSYLCERYSNPNNKPWPTKRLGGLRNFVGSKGTGINITCPKECRPKDHQDWINC